MSEANDVNSNELLDACSRVLESTLRKEICDSWHYSDYGNYPTFDDLPSDLRDAVTKAAAAVLREASTAAASARTSAETDCWANTILSPFYIICINDVRKAMEE